MPAARGVKSANFEFCYWEETWIFQFVPIILLCLLLIDNKKNLSVHNLINPYVKNINYSQIIKKKGFWIFTNIN